MKFEIKKASLKDSLEILKILKKSKELYGCDNEKFTLDEIKDYVGEKRNVVFIVKAGKKIVGVLIAEVWRDYCYLYLFAVLKEYRNNGIGTALIDKLENVVKKEGYIGLYVKKSDRKMIKLIKKRGYKKGDKFIYFHKDLE